MRDIGIVIIGRNEGARLERCFESLRYRKIPIVYVDSGSSDNSVCTAQLYVQTVLKLNPERPFSAARARNEGFAKLLQLHPDLKFVQFLDGDCVLAPQWLRAAESALLRDPQLAAVVGHLQEIYPEATVYNRLCSLEWKSEIGNLADFGTFGGISTIRADVFLKLGGFNPDVIAGEDSELGVRMSLAGYKIAKIDHQMAWHDANIVSFTQWWRRAVRAGHAIGQRAFLNGNSEARDCVRERSSTWFWGLGLPAIVFGLVVPSKGASFFLLTGYIIMGGRVFTYRRRLGDSTSDAILYTKFLLLAKFANCIGLAKFYFNKLNRSYQLIEYK